MVKATRGLLVNCDESVRELLLQMDQTMHFIIETLDTRHVFIDAAQLDAVQKELRRRLAEHVYLAPEHASADD